jgi:hypothetical protein
MAVQLICGLKDISHICSIIRIFYEGIFPSFGHLVHSKRMNGILRSEAEMMFKIFGNHFL